MNLVKISNLLDRVSGKLPNITLEESNDFAWRPETRTINYITKELGTDTGKLQLLHELAHASLEHQDYKFDIELIRLEAEAWAQVLFIAPEYGLGYSENHTQTCLDTYRNWLHQRSTCINCGFISLQIEPSVYKCFNCDTSWRVPHTPICRRVAT